MSFVPLPWCTSKSKIKTFASPCLVCAWRAAAAAVPKRQKPIAPRGSAWCPGGRHNPKPAGARRASPVSSSRARAARTTASTSASAAPTPLSASAYDAVVKYVGDASMSSGARVRARMSSPRT